MAFTRLFLALCAAAALAPLFDTPSPVADTLTTPPWPAEYEGSPIQQVPLSAAEQKVHADFPGKVARFTDGRRELILRWVTTGTRRLHPSSQCFRGLGYVVTEQPPELDRNGARWSCFKATRGATDLRVRERITNAGEEASWTDVSAWYWSTVLHSSRGPWLATTIIEREAQ